MRVHRNFNRFSRYNKRNKNQWLGKLNNGIFFFLTGKFELNSSRNDVLVIAYTTLWRDTCLLSRTSKTIFEFALLIKVSNRKEYQWKQTCLHVEGIYVKFFEFSLRKMYLIICNTYSEFHARYIGLLLEA